MGRDKALLPHPQRSGETFVEHLISVLRSRCAEVCLVARDAAQANLLRASTTLSSVQVVTDATPGAGPLMGLYSGLSVIQSPYALLSAVDMPYVSPAMVAFLRTLASDDAAVVPMVDGAPQVLLSVYPRALLPLIEERLRAGERGPRSLLSLAMVRYVDEAQLRQVDPQLRSFLNVNTPQEFDRLG